MASMVLTFALGHSRTLRDKRATCGFPLNAATSGRGTDGNWQDLRREPWTSGAVKRMCAAHRANAAQFAANVLPIIREVQAGGHNSANSIAGQLNARRVATARGGQWTHVQVRQILERVR
jgi:hypothetical protein